jgi:PAS domain S-box-containing protein
MTEPKFSGRSDLGGASPEMPFPVPADEQARLRALAYYGLAGSPPEERFDRLARLAALVLRAPVALVTFVDADTQWYKAAHGVAPGSTPREIAFCAHAILDDQVLVVADASADPRFADNPDVTGGLGIRFYAGAPIKTREGHRLGTVCVIDQTPRVLSSGEVVVLEELASLAADEVERTLHLREHAEQTTKDRLDADALIESLIESSSDCVKMLDFDGVILAINAHGCELLDIEHFDQVRGVPWLTFWEGEARTLAEAALSAARRSEEGSFTGFQQTAKGTPRWWEVRVIPVSTSIGRPTRLLCLSRDVTEREALLAQLRQANSELESRVAARTNQLEARNRELEEFANAAGHDLQEPLRKIRGFTDLVAQQEAAVLSDEGKRALAKVLDASERMSRLLSDLLALSRLTSSVEPFSEVDLSVTLSEVISDLHVRLDETAGRVQVLSSLPVIRADQSQMHRLLLNLVGNALKYHRSGVPPVVQVRASEQNGHITIVVEDNGIGFDEKYAERIFAPFQRLHAKDAFEGTGMGLAIVRKIVERHGGTVRATSRPGAGSSFTVVMPRAA